VNYMDFDPYLARERHQHMLREVASLRLEKRPRNDRASSGSLLVDLARRSPLPLLRSRNRGGASKVAPRN
jgi:hypothetical protein